MNQTNNSSKQNTTPRADLIRLGLLPHTGERAALYQAALRELDLSVFDYQTIRDVLEIAHLDDSALDAALIALFAARNEGSLCVRADAASLSRRLPAFAARETLIDNFLRNMQSGRNCCRHILRISANH